MYRRVLRFLVTANDVPSTLILITLMMETIRGGQSDTGSSFLRLLRLPLQVINSTNLSKTITIYYIIQVWYNRPINGLSDSGLVLFQSNKYMK
jgi:hypothetical protein